MVTASGIEFTRSLLIYFGFNQFLSITVSDNYGFIFSLRPTLCQVTPLLDPLGHKCYD